MFMSPETEIHRVLDEKRLQSRETLIADADLKISLDRLQPNQPYQFVLERLTVEGVGVGAVEWSVLIGENPRHCRTVGVSIMEICLEPF